MGPLTNEANKKLKDINNRDLFVMICFLVFIFWIGIAPSTYFDLMDATVVGLLENIGDAVMVTAGQ